MDTKLADVVKQRRDAPKLKLIPATALAIQREAEEQEAIQAGLARLAEDAHQLSEAATHVLANIATTAEKGEPIKLMHLNSVASFLAGIHALSFQLPNSNDPIKKSNTLNVLLKASVAPDGLVTDAVRIIAQHGSRYPNIQQMYADMIQKYTKSVDMRSPQGEQLAKRARTLQQKVDSAMRQSRM